MIDYQKMYYELFNEITDVIERLKQIQVNAEERYISAESEEKEQYSVGILHTPTPPAFR